MPARRDEAVKADLRRIPWSTGSALTPVPSSSGQQQLSGLPGLIVAVGLAGLLYVPTAWWYVNRLVALKVSA